MLRSDDLRKALRERGYQELRSAQDGNIKFTMMTDAVHVLVLQEYLDSGNAELYGPLGPINNLPLTIERIPVILKGIKRAKRRIIECLQHSTQPLTPQEIYQRLLSQNTPIRKGSLYTTLRRAAASGELKHDEQWNTYTAILHSHTAPLLEKHNENHL